MKNKEIISIPFAMRLTDEKNWNTTDLKHQYFIMRFHFKIFPRQVENIPKTGEIIGVYEIPEGASIEALKSIEIEKNQLLVTESIKQSIIENTIETGVALEVGNALLNGLNLKGECKKKLIDTISDTFSVSQTISEKITIKFEVREKIQGSAEGKYYAAAAYIKKSYDIYLLAIDYLFVEYKRTIFGLRKKREKYPKPDGNKKHTNLIKINEPLFSIEYWELLPQSSLLYGENSYKNEVENPSEISIVNLDLPYKSIPLNGIIKPTLYQISNVAFPLKWIHRKVGLTEEELKEIEEEECKGSIWSVQQKRYKERKKAA